MKVLFLFHEHPDEPASFPLGAGLLSAVVKQHGHTASGIYLHSDLEQTEDIDRLTEQVRKEAPDILAYSFNSVSFRVMQQVASHLKQEFDLPAIAGGIHPTLYPEDTLAAEGIDYICVGDGEQALPLFLEALTCGDTSPGTPGIWYRRIDGSIVRNRVAPLIEDLDSLPRTDFDIFGTEFIEKLSKDGWFRFLTSRGCPYRCTYCHNRMIRTAYSQGLGLPENKVGFLRFRSVDSVMAELKAAVSRFDLRVINFMDDLFCLNRQRTLEFCQRFRTEFPEQVGYSIQTHLEHLDEELITELKNSRCLRVVVGVESASPRILELFKRSPDIAATEEKIRLLVAARFPLGTWTLNMLGNPTETKKEMIATLALNARNLVERVKVNLMAPYPGSELYDFCMEQNLLCHTEAHQDFSDRLLTRLKFPNEEMAFLEKFGDIGHWYLNAHSPLPVSDLYAALIAEAEKIPFGQWVSAKAAYLARDTELSRVIEETGQQHYRFVFQGKVSARTIGLTGNSPHA